MLASLFGMQQFNSSHKFININLNFARKEFLARNTTTTTTLAPSVQLPNLNNYENDSDIQMEIQRAEADAEKEAVPVIVILANNHVVPVHASTDYLFRGDALEALNFIEYMILIGKEPINKKKSISTKSYSTSTVAADELDDNDDTDDRDCAELLNYDLMDIHVEEETQQITKRAGNRFLTNQYHIP